MVNGVCAITVISLPGSVATLNQYRISNSGMYLKRSKSTGFTIELLAPSS
jgi:hypothetical protein